MRSMNFMDIVDKPIEAFRSNKMDFIVLFVAASFGLGAVELLIFKLYSGWGLTLVSGLLGYLRPFATYFITYKLTVWISRFGQQL